MVQRAVTAEPTGNGVRADKGFGVRLGNGTPDWKVGQEIMRDECYSMTLAGWVWDHIEARHGGITDLDGVVVVARLAHEEWWLSGTTGG